MLISDTMSDTSEESVKDRNSDKEDNSVCRDFFRGICDRKFCKYKHDFENKTLNFCHDYQNNVCPRTHCKFIHCSPEEVEEYKQTGEMSSQILAEATRKNQLFGTQPICSQFKKGQCKRTHCKFRHLTRIQEEAEIMELIQNHTQRKQMIGESITASVGMPCNGFHRRNGVSYEEYQDIGPPFPKRRFLGEPESDILANSDMQNFDGSRYIFKGYCAGNPPPAVLSMADARTMMMEEENHLLHKQIAQLKRQVSDLTATNEFLLDQNANLRMCGKRNGTVNMPAVTITNTNTPQQVIRTVTAASVATVPVSLATVSTCNAVSGNPVSIAGCPTVSIASPAQMLAPNQQILVTTNPAQQLALATSSQLTSQAQHMANQQLALAASAPQQQQLTLTNNAQQLNQQLTSQAQQLANQQLTSQAQQLANQQLTSQAQQLANQQLTSQAHQLANQQLTSQAQQLALANTNQQLTSQTQQLVVANTTQQLTSQAQQLALANTPQQLAVANMPQQLALASTTQQQLTTQAQQLALASTSQQLLAQQNQQMELHRSAINTSQTLAMSNASQPMVSYPIMTQQHAMTH